MLANNPAVNGSHANAVSDPAHPAFDSIPDIIEAFGTLSPKSALDILTIP